MSNTDEQLTLTDVDGDVLTAEHVNRTDGHVVQIAVTTRGGTSVAWLPHDQVAELYRALGNWLMATKPAEPEVKCCRWSNQLCEQPNHHGCTDCPAATSDGSADYARPDLDAEGYTWPETTGPTILEDAQAAVYGDREDDYDHPRVNFTRTAVIWQGLLLHKLADGEHITPDDVGRCQLGVKLARDVNAPKRDNRVDMAGYALTLDRLETGQ